MSLTTVSDRIIDGEPYSVPRRVTPHDVAHLFASMDSEEQALFFNHVAAIASTWRRGAGFVFQLQAITDSSGLTLAGRRVMQEIGEYSHWGLVPRAAKVLADAVHEWTP